jgi:gliding motility-associated-like protein
MKKLLLFSVLLFLSTFISAQTNFIKQDTVYAQSSECVGGVNICIDSISFFSALDYTFTLDGQPYSSANLESCTVDSFYQYDYSGIYADNNQAPIDLLPSRINGQLRAQSFPNFKIFLDSLKVWAPVGNWYADTVSRFILNYPLNDTFNFDGQVLSKKYDLRGNVGYNYIGLKLKVSPGFHTFIATDVLNGSVTDKVILRAACIQKDTVRQTINIGNSANYSVNTTQLLGIPQSSSFVNLCAKATTHVNFNGLSSPSISYLGVSVGNDTACLKICDQYGICDTTILIVTAQLAPSRKITYRDSVAIGAPRESRCAIFQPLGTLNVFEEFTCTTTPQGRLNYTIDKVVGCINFTAVSLGFDTVCIRVCNTLGVCDTTTYILKAYNAPVVVQGVRTRVDDVVTIGAGIKSVCGIRKPAGTINSFKIIGQSTLGHVTFNLDTVGACINFTGLTVGTDSARVIVCNTLGTCDTTVYYVAAQNAPVVVQGTRKAIIDSVGIGNSKPRCDITIPSGVVNLFRIVRQSGLGHVTFSLDTTVLQCMTFTGVTLGNDTAQVVVCNTSGRCDTTDFYIKTIGFQQPIQGSRTRIDNVVTIGAGSKSLCGIKRPTGTVNSFKIIGQSTLGHVTFSLDTIIACINFTGLTVGTDSARVIVCNTVGICDTTVYYITAQTAVVTLDTPRTVFNPTVTIGTPLKTCDIQKPTTGTIAPYTIESQSSTGHVSFAIDNVAGCMTFTGLTVGTDSARVLVCNTLGACVRTVYYVTVQNPVVLQGTRTRVDDVVTIGAGAKSLCAIKKPSGTINSFKIIGQSTLGHVTFNLDTVTACINFTGLTVGTDSARVIVCNTSSICDTTVYYITAQNPVVINQGRKTRLVDTVIIGQPAKTRSDVLIPTGTVATIKDVCIYPRTHVQFNIDQINDKVSFFGLNPAGTDSICLEVCNTQGLCDTTIYAVTSKSVITNYKPGKVTYVDSVAITGLPRQRCDLRLPPGNIVSFTNICPQSSGTKVQFTIDQVTRCVIFKGLGSGFETGCFEVCNSVGQCDTTIYIIRSRPTILPKISGTFIIKDTITEGATRKRCDLEIPDGAISIPATNICVNNSGNNDVLFATDANNCITYQGVKPGFDTACIRVCNINQVCDTTIFIIETKPKQGVVTNRKYVFKDSLIVSNIRSKCDLSQPFNATTIRNLCTVTANNIRFDLNAATRCVNYTALAMGSDSACIEICDGSGLCDTTYMFIKGIKDPTVKPTPSEERITIKINERIKFCPDTTELAGSPINLIKFCEIRNFDNTAIDLKGNDPQKCAVIDGVSAGQDTFCIAISNQAGFFDTTRIYVTVLPDTFRPKIGYDSVSLKIGESGIVCLDSSELWLAVVTDLKNCTNTTVDNSTMIPNPITKCVQLRGISAGRDTICVVLCNAKNICDTTVIYVKVSADTVKPVSSTEVITIDLGKTLVFNKIDSTQIFGAVDTTYDGCPAKHGTHALLVLDRIAKTVTVSGLKPGGPDTICIVVYNKLANLRDTTFLIVTIKDTVIVTPITIQANDDIFETFLGRDTFFSIYTNDLFNGKKPVSLELIKPSKKGLAQSISFNDGKITYTKVGRSPIFCGIDTFRYRVCVLNGRDSVCSEANITVNIVCSDILKVANGFSPNGDTHNETFFIDGLAAYPDNTVLVYNRWGNEVLKSKNYQNDWHGDWQGKNLPDGTYFYMVRDDAKGEVLQTGWVVINR